MANEESAKNYPEPRRGAWSSEEDNLLRKCIQTYGEGNWHQVPLRAGLNRCRKSCRLRWLNYLSPNIKRGPFNADEVDLMLRMHKLLGNKWSLIAGRLSGRTANDVKNYWNAHLKSKKEKKEETIEKVSVIRPQPRSISKGFVWQDDRCKISTPMACVKEDPSKPITEAASADNSGTWWESWLPENEIGQTSLGRTEIVAEGNSTDIVAEENKADIMDEESNDYLMSPYTAFDIELSNFVNGTMPKTI